MKKIDKRLEARTQSQHDTEEMVKELLQEYTTLTVSFYVVSIEYFDASVAALGSTTPHSAKSALHSAKS